VDKYKAAALISNKALTYVYSLCIPGANVIDICKAGDQFIATEVAKIYGKKQNLPKGVGFPTCISVNNCVGHFSPLESDPPSTLNAGDVIKIDLGTHVDGFTSQFGHTLICVDPAAAPEQVTGRRADVICAAHFAGECALRLIRPGNKASQVTQAIAKVAETFQCHPVAGVSSNKVDRFAVVTDKIVANRATEGEKLEDVTFEQNEAYIIDIVMSTGEGKPKESNVRTSVYRKTDQIYNLKVKASRYLYNEIATKFNTMPFTLRSLQDENRARLGTVECLKHEL